MTERTFLNPFHTMLTNEKIQNEREISGLLERADQLDAEAAEARRLAANLQIRVHAYAKALQAAPEIVAMELIAKCPDCDATLGIPEPGWWLEHHTDGSHTAHPGAETR